MSNNRCCDRAWVLGMLAVMSLASWTGFAADPPKGARIAYAFKACDAVGKATAEENLMMAYQNELNAQLQYAAYARKAEREGYMSAAIEFWVTSSGEGGHARTIAKEIKRQGGKPKSGISIPVVKSTKENLQMAIKKEADEAEKTWADSLHSAQEAVHDTTNYDGFDISTQCPASVKAHPSVQVFLMLKTVDASYAKHFTDCLKALEDGKDAPEYFLEPGGLKIRMDGIKLLKQYGLD